MSAERPAASSYEEGDRCAVCGYWYWSHPAEGVGWHSLVPITYYAHPELRRMVFCPTHLTNDPLNRDAAWSQR